jgi:hypothetical protein
VGCCHARTNRFGVPALVAHFSLMSRSSSLIWVGVGYPADSNRVWSRIFRAVETMAGSSMLLRIELIMRKFNLVSGIYASSIKKLYFKMLKFFEKKFYMYNFIIYLRSSSFTRNQKIYLLKSLIFSIEFFFTHATQQVNFL